MCFMRSLNFRDNVLWAICYRKGIDPVPPPIGLGELLKDQARALVSFINAWVHRFWPVADWPEWTLIVAFVPANHIVPYSAIPFAADGLPSEIDRTVKVYLCDPRTTPGDGLNTPFTLLPEGVHVGFMHGPEVWIKYQEPAPRFTSDEWDSSRTYSVGELSYSNVSGECYSSLSNNNKGNDPSFVDHGALKRYPVPPDPGPGPYPVPVPFDKRPGPAPMSLEVTQQWVASNPGAAGQNAIVKIDLNLCSPGPAPPDPVPNGVAFNVTVYDYATALAYNANYITAGSTPLATVITQLKTTLDGLLGALSYTITIDTTNHWIEISAARQFDVMPPPTNYIDSIVHYFKITQLQPYIPLIPSASTGVRKAIKVTLPTSQVLPGAQYIFKFIDQNQMVHAIAYTALSTDGPLQVLAGLMAAIAAAASSDTYFEDVASSIDTAGQSVTVSVGTPFTLDAVTIPSYPPAWVMIPFPEKLVDPVVRGVLSDWLKEEGQQDKGDDEEKNVPQEVQLKTAEFARAAMN